MRIRQPNTVLIALMNDLKDFATLQNKGWYRIRIGKRTPLIVRDGSVKYIAFYHTAKFKKEKFTVRWYADVKKISKVSRRDLFPDEPPRHTKSENQYYKIEVKDLRLLPEPIISLRHRRILFIPTTETKFFGAMQLQTPEINFLFNDSPLENLLFGKLMEKNVLPERQYYIQHKNENWFLDFALFCKTVNIDLECDGLKYHYSSIEQKMYDNSRNNNLARHGWKVLRYHTIDLTQNLDSTLNEIMDTIDRNGGIQDVVRKDVFHYVSDNPQLRLFD